MAAVFSPQPESQSSHPKQTSKSHRDPLKRVARTLLLLRDGERHILKVCDVAVDTCAKNLDHISAWRRADLRNSRAPREHRSGAKQEQRGGDN